MWENSLNEAVPIFVEIQIRIVLTLLAQQPESVKKVNKKGLSSICLFRLMMWMQPAYHSQYCDQAAFRTVHFWQGKRFFFLQTVHTRSVGNPASYSVDAKNKAARI
jgi:hypothetical protein